VCSTAEDLNLGAAVCSMMAALVEGLVVPAGAALKTGLGAKPPLELPCIG